MQDYEFKIFQELLKVLAGINIKDDQKLMVETRLQRRLFETGIDNFSKYLKHIQTHPSKEIPYLISILTTHTTHFFREKEHFNYLENKFIPELLNKDNRRYIQLWSAACSSGEEAYSLAITVLEYLRENNLPKKVKIIGSDIDIKMIQIAKEGVYRTEQIKDIPEALQKRYFSFGSREISDFVKVKNSLKDVLEFQRKNLFSPPYFRETRQFDVIFIRNVFIYFDKHTIKNIIFELAKNLTPDGILVLGHTENILDIISPYKLLYNSIYCFKSYFQEQLKDAKANVDEIIDIELASKENAFEKEKEKEKEKESKKDFIPITTANVASTVDNGVCENYANKKVNVLIIDDSPTVRMMLKRVLSVEHNFNIFAEAPNPIYAEKILQKSKEIDVITLDINMDQKDGITYLAELSQKKEGHPPVVMISSISQEDAVGTLRAFELGAFDYIEKPEANRLPEISEHIRMIVREAAISGWTNKKKEKGEFLQTSVVKNVSDQKIQKVEGKVDGKFDKFDFVKNKSILPSVKSSFVVQNEKRKNYITFDSKELNNSLILIGASTGGVVAIKEILEVFPAETPPILIVQHIPSTFSKVFADRLSDVCKIKVKEAEDGEDLNNSKAYVAPGGRQMKITEKGTGFILNVNKDPPVNKHQPSVDYLFSSVANLKEKNKHKFDRKIVAVVLTGMGADGAKGLLMLRNQGAFTIAQDEYSSVVYGMPKVAKEIGAAVEVVKLSDIADTICQYLRK